MLEKTYHYSKVSWDEQNQYGEFIVTSNRGKMAKGYLKKSVTGNILALIQETDYAKSYVNRKVGTTLNTIFGDDDAGVLVQGPIDCLPGHIYTRIKIANGLYPNDQHILTGSFDNFCNKKGIFICGGKSYVGPEKVVFIGSVIGVCDGVPKEYAKFKVV